MKAFRVSRSASQARAACLAVLVIPLVVPWLWCVGRFGGPPAASTSRWVSEDREVFHGIAARVEFEIPPGARPEVLLAAAWAEFDGVARVANSFDPDSEVGRLNAAIKTRAVQVSRELFELLELSLWAFRETDGAFDPTVWPLKRLWRQAAGQGRAPALSEVREALTHVGMSRIHLTPDRNRVSFDRPDMALDFGGIAKGYVVDRVARMFESAGVRSYLVRCGGEVAVLGRSPRGEPWSIGVRHPFRPGDVVGVLSGPDRLSVSTSGPTEQPIRAGDRLVHHILDPRTGQPAPLSVLAVTVVIRGTGPGTARADALSTALSVLGSRRGLDVLAGIPDADALFLVPGPGGVLAEVRSPGMSAIYRDLE